MKKNTVLATFFFPFFILFSLPFSQKIFAEVPGARIQNPRAAFSSEDPFPTPVLQKEIYTPRTINTVIGFPLLPNTPRGFHMRMSNSRIDFGELSPTNPVLRSLTIGITADNVPAYNLIVYENNPLSQNQGILLPDTSCDNGTCSAIRATLWNNTLAFGFGYRCEKNDTTGCQTDFSQPESYRSFAHANQLVPVILTGGIFSRTADITVTHKINMSGSQPPGAYSNTLTYVLVPGY